MADSTSFDVACDALERESGLSRLEARGTLRIALKRAGLESKNVRPSEIQVVADKVLPDELRQRGVEDAERVCTVVSACMKSVPESQPEAGPDAVFERLGGNR